MSGHHPWPSPSQWPPGRLNDDLQVNKREVFRLGDWSIYDATEVGIQSVQPGVTNAHWSSFIMHCRTWKEWEQVMRPNSTTWIKGELAPNKSGHYKIQVTKRCNANMTAEDRNHCPDCGIKIPNEVVALWKLQNFDKIQELNSV